MCIEKILKIFIGNYYNMTAIISNKFDKNISVVNTSADWYIIDTIKYLDNPNYICISEREFNENMENFPDYFCKKHNKVLVL